MTVSNGTVKRLSATADGHQLVIVQVKRQACGIKVSAELPMREGQSVAIKIEHGLASLA